MFYSYIICMYVSAWSSPECEIMCRFNWFTEMNFLSQAVQSKTSWTWKYTNIITCTYRKYKKFIQNNTCRSLKEISCKKNKINFSLQTCMACIFWRILVDNFGYHLLTLTDKKNKSLNIFLFHRGKSYRFETSWGKKKMKNSIAELSVSQIVFSNHKVKHTDRPDQNRTLSVWP